MLQGSDRCLDELGLREGETMELSCGALLGGSFKKQNDDSTPAKKTKK